MLTEFLHALRRLSRSPGFVAICLATLGLCIGANAAIFAFVNSVLLRPLPFRSPERIVTLVNSYPKAGLERDGASLATYYERRGRLPAFESLSALAFGSANVGEGNSVARLELLRVTPEFFSTLGVNLAFGHPFNESEMTYQTDGVVILSDSYWHQAFNADPKVLGGKLWIDGFERQIVGVLPPTFRYPTSDARIIVPLSSSPDQRMASSRYTSGYEVIGRLARGVSVAQAQSQIDADYSAHRSEFPWTKDLESTGFHQTVVPLHNDIVSSIRPSLILIQCGAFLLLTIGAVNIANLFLVRTAARTKEFAVRRSLGARWVDVTRCIAAETVIICVAGGCVGLAVGDWAVRLAGNSIASAPLGISIAFDSNIAWITLAGSFALGLTIAVPIAALDFGRKLDQALKSEGRSASLGLAPGRMRDGFAIAQVALAFVLLEGAGLLGLTLKHAMSVSPGFRPSHVIAGAVDLPWKTYPNDSSRLAFADRVLESVAKDPGIQAAGIISDVPLRGQGTKAANNAMTIQGFDYAKGAPSILHDEYGVTGEYFAALGIPLVEGRYLDASDSHRPFRACVVDEDFARHYWPTGTAIGHRLWEGPPQGRADSDTFTIVGVVGRIKQTDPTDTHTNGAVYFPYRSFPSSNLYVVTRSSAQSGAAEEAMRVAVRAVDSELPMSDLKSMDQRLDDSLEERRSPVLLAGVFGSIALVLAALGTYGVVSTAVAQRKREIGIRMALGAQPALIRIHFLRKGLRQLAMGTVVGVVGAWYAGKAMSSLLFQVPPFDLEVLVFAAAVLAGVSIAACLVPSSRAARVSPSEALAEE